MNNTEDCGIKAGISGRNPGQMLYGCVTEPREAKHTNSTNPGAGRVHHAAENEADVCCVNDAVVLE